MLDVSMSHPDRVRVFHGDGTSMVILYSGESQFSLHFHNPKDRELKANHVAQVLMENLEPWMAADVAGAI